MKIVDATVKSCELVYPNRTDSGYVNVEPFYKTVVFIEEENKECVITDVYAYFNVGSKIKVKYDGKNAYVEEILHKIPYQVNTLVDIGRKHSLAVVIFFVISFVWMVLFATKNSKLALLPFTLCILAGIINIFNYFKVQKGIIITGTIKDILKGANITPNSRPSYYYLYEYPLNGNKYIHRAFTPGAKLENVGNKVSLIYNEKNNLMIEQNKRTKLLLQGVFSIILGLLLLLIIFM